MNRIKRWLQVSGAEFWLPLPFVAIVFWLGSSVLTAQELQHSQPTTTPLQADTQLEATVSVNILLINAVIYRAQNSTQVEVETAEPILRQLELELPLTDPNQIEEAIAQELQLSRQQVRQLVLQTPNFATWGVGGEAPKKGWNPFTPYKTFVLLY